MARRLGVYQTDERKLPGLIADFIFLLEMNMKLKYSSQIIIEAVSGQTRLSDIAFDDVSLLTDDECDESDEDAKAQDLREDDDGVLTVESCVNRCFEDKNSTVRLSANHTLSCSCSVDCDPKTSCCPDFIG